MVLKNNLKPQLAWMSSSKANIPSKGALMNLDPNTLNSSPLDPSQKSSSLNRNLPNRVPLREPSPVDDSPKLNNSVLDNVQKAERTSTLRVARRENSGRLSNGSSGKNSSPVPQPPQPQPPQPPITSTVQKPQQPRAAVIDLTFDDDEERFRTPSAASKRLQPLNPILPTTLKKQKRSFTDQPTTSHKERNVTNDYDDSDLNDLDNIDFTARITTSKALSASDSTISTTSTTGNVGLLDSVLPKHPNEKDRLLRLQSSYIDIIERRIKLLTDRVLVEEDMTISELQKRQRRADLTGQYERLGKDQKNLKNQITSFTEVPQERRPSFQAIDPVQTIDSALPNVLMQESLKPTAPVIAPAIATTPQQTVIPPSIPNNVEVPETSILSNDLQRPCPSSSVERTRDFEQHNRPIPDDDGDVFYDSQIDLANEDRDDFAGNRTMDGLMTSDPEEEYDTDLSGFVVDAANIESDDGSFVEHTPNNSDVEYGDDIPKVSQSEVHNLRNSSDDEEDIEMDSVRSDVSVASEDEEIYDSHNLQTIRSEDTRIPELSIIEDDDGEEDEDEEIAGISPNEFEGEREANTQHNPIYVDDEEDDDLMEYANNLPPPRNQSFETIPSSPINIQTDEEDDLDDLDSLFQKDLPPRQLNEIPPNIEQHSWTPEVFAKLRQVFKLENFRSNQLAAVNATLSGKDCFVLMPTGGGKSLCYQLPAIVKAGKTRGTTIVVSPLISLMQDQVEHLWDKNIRAGMINSKSPMEERKHTFHLFISGQLDLVYLSPEMISQSKQARRAIDTLYEKQLLARIVVDEAHCVSSWGHDFRPDYTELSFFKTTYKDIPIMALTATANDHVKKDIVHNLGLVDPVELKQSFNRTNLFYEVLPKDKNHMKHLEESLKGKFKGQTGIIYCHSKNSCEQTAEKLTHVGVKAAFYHAGMNTEDRLYIQKAWQSGEIKVICATIAFGMGIDKPDVRVVFHLTLPRTLEGYYQETGRAGRDGKHSDCIMYYTLKDGKTLQTMISKDKDLDRESKEKHLNKLAQVMQYCNNSIDCRRKQVLQYFNEEFNKKDCHKQCDNCLATGTQIEKDVTEHAIKITQLVKSLQAQQVTLIQCEDIFKGFRHSRISQYIDSEFHGAGKELDKNQLGRITFHLVSEKILEEYSIMNKAGFSTSYVRIGPKAQRLLNHGNKIIMSFSEPKKNNPIAEVEREPTRVLNHAELNAYRLDAPPIISARTHLERSSSELGGNNQGFVRPKVPAVPIRLGQMAFPNEKEREGFAYAFRILNDKRNQLMAQLSYSNSTSVLKETTLKEMAKILPTTEAEYLRLPDLTEEQKKNFKSFREVLIRLKSGGGSSSANEKYSKYFRSEQEEKENVAVIDSIKASQHQGTGPSSQQSSQKSKKSSGKKSYKSRGGGVSKYWKSQSSRGGKRSSQGSRSKPKTAAGGGGGGARKARQPAMRI